MRPMVAYGVCQCDILGANATSQNFFCRARCARNSARLRLADCSFPHVPKNTCLLSGTFIIVSILIAGMASKQGTINFGQKRKAPEPDVEKGEKLERGFVHEWNVDFSWVRCDKEDGCMRCKRCEGAGVRCNFTGFCLLPILFFQIFSLPFFKCMYYVSKIVYYVWVKYGVQGKIKHFVVGHSAATVNCTRRKDSMKDNDILSQRSKSC
jgi:hypothetical protein